MDSSFIFSGKSPSQKCKLGDLETIIGIDYDKHDQDNSSISQSDRIDAFDWRSFLRQKRHFISSSHFFSYELWNYWYGDKILLNMYLPGMAKSSKNGLIPGEQNSIVAS